MVNAISHLLRPGANPTKLLLHVSKLLEALHSLALFNSIPIRGEKDADMANLL